MAEETVDIGLDPNYKPAEHDSMVIVRFSGNTSRIGSWQPINLDPFQMWALGDWLHLQAEKLILQEEAKAAVAHQDITGRPPSDSILTLDGLRGER